MEDGRWKIGDGSGEALRAPFAISHLQSPISYPGFAPSKTAKAFGKRAFWPPKTIFNYFQGYPADVQPSLLRLSEKMKIEAPRKLAEAANPRANHGWTQMDTDRGRHEFHQSSRIPDSASEVLNRGCGRHGFPLFRYPCHPHYPRSNYSDSGFYAVATFVVLRSRSCRDDSEMDARFGEMQARFPEMDARFSEMRISANLAKSRQISGNLGKSHSGEIFHGYKRHATCSTPPFNA